MSDRCKICESKLQKIFSGEILNKYVVDYFECENCGFIQTENPYWLKESYSSVIALTDVGLVSRNLKFRNITSWIINTYLDHKAKFIDYAGGYGLFVRLMRDYGLDFYRQDYYCENFFAKYFDVDDENEDVKFELLTAFEVFEHLENPIEEIQKMFNFSDVIFFSTELQPQYKINCIDDWRYFAKETGQHIVFYNIRSLELIAEKMNCYLYSNKENLHILSRKMFSSNPFDKWEDQNKKSFVVKSLYKVSRYFECKIEKKTRDIKLESLLEKDYEFLIQKMNKK